ncbi:MAG: DEAD/DEAH box helicase [Alphaproteobacteria bacterium]|nr:DEAD/DEAH box helicase [Alphaproteobacteria bacterium]
MENFSTLGLPEEILHALNAMQFQTPTPIQAQTIPPALLGHDILGTAQTGTGKTAAYGIPLVAYLMNNPFATALVLTPTRELAGQVLSALKLLLGERRGKRGPIATTLLIGGDSMFNQLKELRNKPRLIVGTPGRINDHLSRGSLSLRDTGFLVLDETDRMLDMGFSIQLDAIAEHLPQKRQTLMFSATMPPEIIKMAKNYLKDAIRISIGSTTTAVDKIKQEIVRTTENEKYALLLAQLDKLSADGSYIIFVKTKQNTERLADKLCDHGYSADAIHGDLRQRNRERVINAFRAGRNRILVATDIAARGLDIPHIECVVNYDLPQCPEDYIHRIGRTGRAGAEGRSVSFITSQDSAKWRSICNLMNPGEKNDSRHMQLHPGRGHSGGGQRDARDGDARGPKRTHNNKFRPHAAAKGGPQKAGGRSAAPRKKAAY